jgi:hypothetical protein
MSLTRGSWISLFAMLMIFIGPLISQSMPMDHVRPCHEHGHEHGHAGMEHADHGAQPAASTARRNPGTTSCGKMRLLQPAVQLPGADRWRAFTTFAPARQHFHPTSPRLGHARQTFFPGARTRAPPVARVNTHL